MCGIAGLVQRTPLPEGLLGRMTDRLAHRGPDGSGAWLATWNGWRVALGHRRLAIIDPAGGHQPMGNEDGSLQLAFNGEVYGHQQLRADLAALGHRFRTRSDTEAVLHKLEQSAHDIPAGLASLDGMFALALWDQSRGRLLLARDRAGIKPLFYAALPCGGVAFASELTALLMHPAIDRAIDPDSLMSYLFMDYCMAPGCMVRGVRKLEPATYLLWENGVLREPRSYWRLGAAPQQAPADRRGRVERLRQLLAASVQTRLMADVPVGLFLSGGLEDVLGAHGRPGL
jgi:asparagine synthase (glutamine-hydrolysing)